MKALIWQSSSLPKCPEKGVPVETEEDIVKTLMSLYKNAPVFPIIFNTNLGEHIKLCYRANRKPIIDIGINPFTGEPYHWFTFNENTGELDGTYSMGTGRIIGLLPNYK